MRATAPLLLALVLALLLVEPSCSVTGLAPDQAFAEESDEFVRLVHTFLVSRGREQPPIR